MDNSLSKFQEISSNRLKPFIGYEGLGAKFSVKNKDEKIIIRETVFSQLWLIACLFAVGPGINIIFFLNQDEIFKKPVFILVIVTLFSLVGWIFGTKYLLRLLLKRRIEIDSSGTINLFVSRSMVQRTIHFRDVVKFDIWETLLRKSPTESNSDYSTNFTVRLMLKNDETVLLCTSENKKSIETIYDNIKNLHLI